MTVPIYQSVTLLTTLTDCEHHPAADLAALYARRGEIETAFGHMKRTMNMRTLRCKTIEGVEKELSMYALAYNLVRMSMVTKGMRIGLDPQRLGFADVLRGARQVWLEHIRSGE